MKTLVTASTLTRMEKCALVILGKAVGIFKPLWDGIWNWYLRKASIIHYFFTSILDKPGLNIHHSTAWPSSHALSNFSRYFVTSWSTQIAVWDFHHDNIRERLVLLPMVNGTNSCSVVHCRHNFLREVTQNLNIFMSASRLVARSRLLIRSFISFISLRRVPLFPIDMLGLSRVVGVFANSSFSMSWMSLSSGSLGPKCFWILDRSRSSDNS